MGREEKGEGGDRGDLAEKKESSKGERAVKPVILFPSKNSTEDWVLRYKIYNRYQKANIKNLE